MTLPTATILYVHITLVHVGTLAKFIFKTLLATTLLSQNSMFCNKVKVETQLLSDSKVDWGSKTSKHLKFVCLSNFSRLQRNSEYRMTPIIFGHYDWLIYHVLESRYSICSKIENITHYHANWVWILLISKLISFIRHSEFHCICKNFQYSGSGFPVQPGALNSFLYSKIVYFSLVATLVTRQGK